MRGWPAFCLYSFQVAPCQGDNIAATVAGVIAGRRAAGAEQGQVGEPIESGRLCKLKVSVLVEGHVRALCCVALVDGGQVMMAACLRCGFVWRVWA